MSAGVQYVNLYIDIYIILKPPLLLLKIINWVVKSSNPLKQYHF